MGLAMKRRFWEEDDQIFGGHLYSNLPLGEFSYPSNDYFTQKGVLLGLYANGPVGDLLDQPVKARVEHVLMHASKVHPQIRQEFESAYAVWWRKVKYSQGGYASGVGRARARRSALEGGQPDRHRLRRHRAPYSSPTGRKAPSPPAGRRSSRCTSARCARRSRPHEAGPKVRVPRS